MKFELNNSFDDNLAIFKSEVETIDAECAKILFENMSLLSAEGDNAPNRAAIAEFHREIVAALDKLPETAEQASI